MTFKQGQAVNLVSGKYAGKAAWFSKLNPHRPGWCFVYFPTANVSGAQVRVSEIEAA